MEKVLGKHREVPGAPAEAGRCLLTTDDLTQFPRAALTASRHRLGRKGPKD